MKRMPLYILMGALLCGLPLVCNPYWLDVCVMIGLYALLALSLNVILGQAGIFHMGHAAFYAVGAYVTAILNTLCHWPIFWTMPLAGAAAALFALLVARPIIHLRGDYLLIVTIGIVEIVRIALINDVFGLTGGSNGIFGISRPRFFGYKIVKSVQFYYLVWGMVGVSLLLFYGLWRSRFGRALNYIKEDDVAAEGCGVNVTRYKLLVMMIWRPQGLLPPGPRRYAVPPDIPVLPPDVPPGLPPRLPEDAARGPEPAPAQGRPA